jgi:hypothetical protein
MECLHYDTHMSYEITGRINCKHLMDGWHGHDGYLSFLAPNSMERRTELHFSSQACLFYGGFVFGDAMDDGWLDVEYPSVALALAHDGIFLCSLSSFLLLCIERRLRCVALSLSLFLGDLVEWVGIRSGRYG